MSEGVRRLRANRVIAGRTCDWCDGLLEFGEDAAVCESCETPHHAACWDERGGCSGEGCVNAPLKRLPPSVPPPPVPRPAAPPIPTRAAAPIALPPVSDKPRVRCIHCGHQMSTRSEFCRRCKQVQTPDGIYHGPKTTAPGAAASLTYGILSVTVCAFLFSIFAITSSITVKRRIENDPRLGGEKMATAAMVLGCVGLGLHVVFLLVYMFTERSL